MDIHTAIAIGIALYLVLMMGVSLFWMRRISNPADYLVGGRSFPFWILTGNITAGCIGTGVTVGASGLAYQHGWAGAAYPIGLGLGTVLVGLMFAVMRRYRFMTLSEEIASYYGGNRAVVGFSNISIFVSQLCWLTVQIMGGAAVLSAVTSLSPHFCVIAAGLITAAIVLSAGLKSVVYTDFLQAIILLTGFAFLTYSALHHSGGLTGLRQTVPRSYFSFLGTASYGGWQVGTLIMTLSLSVIADPGRRLSIYSSLSENGARWALICAGMIVLVFSAAVAITGMYAYRLNPHLADPDQSLIWLVMNVLPTWLAAMVVVSVASGIISCANGPAMAVGTFFVRHIYPLATGHYAKRPILTVRLALVGAFSIATLTALGAGTIIGFVIKFLPITMSGLAIIILIGRFWSRATWQGAMTALVTTPVASILVLFAPLHEAYWAVFPPIVGAVAHVLVSLKTPRSERGFAQVAEAMSRERNIMEGSGTATGTVSGQPM